MKKEIFKYIRNSLELSQKDLADLMGCNYNTINAWEHARKGIEIPIFAEKLIKFMYKEKFKKEWKDEFYSEIKLSPKDLTNFRKRKGLSLKEFSKLIDENYSSLFYYENGKRKIPQRVKIKINKLKSSR